MIEGKYILADMCVGIRSLYDEVQRMCEDYRAPMDATPDFIVETTEADIEAERKQSEETPRRGCRRMRSMMHTWRPWRSIAGLPRHVSVAGGC